MNLAYLDFIGAIEYSGPTIEIEEPVNDREYHYLEVEKINNTVKDLSEALEKAKKEQEAGIKNVYSQIQDLVHKNNSKMRSGYIKHELETKLPRAIVREGKLCTGNGDVIFTENSIYIFMDYFNIDLLDDLREKFSSKIYVKKGILSKDPIEIIIDMSEVTSEDE